MSKHRSGCELALGLLLAAVFTSAAIGQSNVSCYPMPTGQTVRAEGLAELVGEVTITCQSYNYWNPSPLPESVNIRLTLNTVITSNKDFGQGLDTADALALVDANAPYPVVPFNSRRYGRLVSDKSIEWVALPLAAPGTPTYAATIRLVNIRAKAFAVPGNTIYAAISVTSGSTQLLNTENMPLPLAFIQPGLAASLHQGGMETFRIRITEVNPTAFKRLGSPIGMGLPSSEQESGFYPTPGSGVTDGGATQGTRFLIHFVNTAGGSRILLPHVIETPTLQVKRVFQTDPNGGGGCVYGFCTGAIQSGSFGETSKFGREEIAVYEVTNNVWASMDQLDVPVSVCQGASGGNGCHVLTTMASMQKLQVRVSLAPVSTVHVSDALAPEPRFNDSGVLMDVVKWPF